jgi:chromate transporter
MVAGILGGTLTTWVTFVPCFLWIFVAAPHVEKIRRNRALAAALSAITAAVVGVVLNLALWFALHVLFLVVEEVRIGPMTLDLPVLATWNPAACVLSALALLAVFRLKLGLGWVIGLWAALGLLLYLVRFGPLATVI